ncbi:copper-binding protein [Candidatus Nucleicultrix amoebiphila]|uniref:copper-binding protein n=1 Tax=Candidatus Nucleicultrix amoebiphila TaxID=1509244 RepID=UPI000A271B27|nr:copper-binding protein [Candidatus Nucleicultrix amoebiphila]
MITNINKRMITHFILSLSITFISWEVMAEGSNMNPSQEVKSNTVVGHGTIEGIDEEKHQLTIKHDPIKALDWPGMTMAFSVSEKVDMSQLRAGTIINFHLEKDINNQMQITHIEKN